ncbi:hypothetical protein AMATHDRAFT_66274 [Amanita thiersii Skay4041]|uniref:Uncharacterized protein n=1 Tax=Amanita thiersii Skay4041 TaxID=703135 RepID=A0A2A9NK30_9AGAR|nr:hypothetical protein AMATHDRAFT_66274 [Amanita thiersii Skay4041]
MTPDEMANPRFITRTALNAVLGDDIIPHHLEIATIPCSGLRISQGALTGHLAWRFVVRLPLAPGQSKPNPHQHYTHHAGRSIVTNFVLDTASSYCVIPQECLAALGYNKHRQPVSVYTPPDVTKRLKSSKSRPGLRGIWAEAGEEEEEEEKLVSLDIQGVRVKCRIGQRGEAGKLNAQFLIDGGLHLCFDPRTSDPVLFVISSHDDSRLGFSQVPRTVIVSTWNRVRAVIGW